MKSKQNLIGQLEALQFVFSGQQQAYLRKAARILRGQYVSDAEEVLGWLERMAKITADTEDEEFYAEILSAVEAAEYAEPVA